MPPGNSKRKYNKNKGKSQGKGRRRYGTTKRTTGVQNEFKLARPMPSTVKALSTMAECKKYRWHTGMASTSLVNQGIREFYVNNDTNACTFLPLHSFISMKKSFNAGEYPWGVEGRDIFSKFLQMKLEITYPQARYGPKKGVRPLEVIYGFCEPLNLTDQTTPREDNVSNTEIGLHIAGQVGPDFDETNDSMLFQDRRRRAYNIVGRFKVKPDRRHLITGPIANADSGTALSTNADPPPIRRNVTFKMNKKIRLWPSTQVASGPASDPILYPRSAYLPFVALVNPDYENYEDNVPAQPDKPETAEDHQIKVRYHDCHWFNDF